jgi:hypothetical protein
MKRLLLLLAAACLLAGCSRNETPSAEKEAAKEGKDAESPEARAAREKKEAEAEKKAEQEKLKSAIEAAEKELRNTASGTAEERRKAYEALVERISAAQGKLDVKPYQGYLSPRAVAIRKRLDDIASEEEKDKAAAPNIPEKPKNEPPKYDGAYQLTGRVRKCYADGVLLSKGKKYYFIKDARCPDVDILYGYVEETFGTVQADIGRDGREAVVVTISDKETAQDDRADHRKAVKEYADEYKKQKAAYDKAVAENSAAVRTLEANNARRDAERTRLYSELDGILAPLAKGGPSAAPASSDTVALDSIPTEDKAAPTAPKPAAAGAQLPAAQAAPKPAATPVPAPRTSNRRACMRGCVSQCGGDANCERSCVASKCR